MGCFISEVFNEVLSIDLTRVSFVKEMLSFFCTASNEPVAFFDNEVVFEDDVEFVFCSLSC